ncbi:MAG: VCBS repeat-containing protein [Xanthobacteraceae bacterium]|nr:VCBS repeat-containing protein [Xanthobacteraceae bacterium]
MRRCYLAITQMELNLQFSEDGHPVRHYPRALLLDPSQGWSVRHLNLSYPGSISRVDTAEFVVSAVGDLDGDGRPELVYAVTLDRADCWILAYRHDGKTLQCAPVIERLPSVELVRSIALGDLDKDGAEEIVLGTRSSGTILIVDRGPTGYFATTIDGDQYGQGTTNTREVTVVDIDSDGMLEILVATAKASAENWHATPGSIFLYRQSANGWSRTLIDDHGGRTHTRMVAVADVKNDGVKRIVSSAVGVVRQGSDHIVLEPELRFYTLTGGRVVCEPIATLENMIKSRSFAAGDIDDNGRTALIVGTRATGAVGLNTTALFIYRFDPQTLTWHRETIDTSGPLGFHCVAVGDIDGDGRREVIASDDGRGEIKVYKKNPSGWQSTIVYAARTPIFCSAIHLIEYDL